MERLPALEDPSVCFSDDVDRLIHELQRLLLGHGGPVVHDLSGPQVAVERDGVVDAALADLPVLRGGEPHLQGRHDMPGRLLSPGR